MYPNPTLDSVLERERAAQAARQVHNRRQRETRRHHSPRFSLAAVLSFLIHW